MACLNANFFCAKGALLTLTSFASHHLASTSLFRDGQRLSDAQTSNNSEHISSGRLVWHINGRGLFLLINFCCGAKISTYVDVSEQLSNFRSKQDNWQ